MKHNTPQDRAIALQAELHAEYRAGYTPVPPRKYAVAELTGALLDAAVLKALLASGAEVHTPGSPLPYSSSWQFGGPIIDREHIGSYFLAGVWTACVEGVPDIEGGLTTMGPASAVPVQGPTKLIACMRAFVAAKLGQEVEL